MGDAFIYPRATKTYRAPFPSLFTFGMVGYIRHRNVATTAIFFRYLFSVSQVIYSYIKKLQTSVYVSSKEPSQVMTSQVYIDAPPHGTPAKTVFEKRMKTIRPGKLISCSFELCALEDKCIHGHLLDFNYPESLTPRSYGRPVTPRKRTFDLVQPIFDSESPEKKGETSRKK